MRKFYLLLTLFYFVGYSQTGTDAYGINNYAKIPKGKCKIDHKCDIKYHIDEFNDRTEYKTDDFYGSKMSYTGGNKPLTVSFIKSVNSNSDSNLFGVFSGNVKGCITKEASVIILLKNGEKIVLPTSSQKIDCGRDFIIVNISNENALRLIEEEPIKLRILYDDNSEDFELSDKGILKMKEKINCITKIE